MRPILPLARFRASGWLALCLLALSGALPGAAAPASTGPDVRHYDLAVTPDFETRRVRIVATLLVDNAGRDSVVSFGLSDRWTDVRVRDGDAPVRFEHADGWITVRLDDPAAVDTLVFEIDGRPGESFDEDRPVVTEHDLFLLWSDRFYPIAFDDWATVRTTIDLPEGFRAIAPGREISREPGPTGTRLVFETTRPARWFSIFADHRWVRSQRTVGDLRVVTLLHPGSVRHAERIARTSADVVGFYTDLHGGYPHDGFAFVTLEGIYARRAFPGFVGYSPEYLDREMERTGHDAHETALLWWDLGFGGRGPGSFQWTEGLGDYLEFLYDEARDLPVPAIFERFRSEYLASSPDEEPALTELRGNTPQKFVHGKYPWLMHVLRYGVGDEAFRAGLRTLYGRHRFETFSIDEMVAAFETAADRPLDWWREEWLERRGVPVIALESSIEGIDGGWRVSGRVVQTGEIYHVPLEIGVETAAGRIVERVELTGRETLFAFEVPARPTRIVADPDGWLLMRGVEPTGDVTR